MWEVSLFTNEISIMLQLCLEQRNKCRKGLLKFFFLSALESRNIWRMLAWNSIWSWDERLALLLISRVFFFFFGDLVTRVLVFLMFSGMTTCPVLIHPCLEPSSCMRFLQATQVTGAISSLEPTFLLHCLLPIICQLSIFYFINITAARIYLCQCFYSSIKTQTLWRGIM